VERVYNDSNGQAEDDCSGEREIYDKYDRKDKEQDNERQQVVSERV
jgi:hypothetical protein